MSQPAAELKPSHTRWTILALLLAISIITYIDRVNISVTARQMIPALGLTNVQMGQIFSAFVLGYALFQIPGGRLGDRWGPRTVLTLAVVWWSLFTAMTALAPSSFLAGVVGIWGSLMIVRFLIGVGEAAALPNFNRTVANWCGPHERGLGIAITISGIGVGSALTPPITAWIMVNYGWQMAFYWAGGLGMLIAMLWFRFATDRPEAHPRVNAGEAALIRGNAPLRNVPEAPTPVPWKAFAQTPSVWWLVLSYTCFGYVAYVYLSWFYLYLVDVRHFSVLRGAFFAASPFIAMMIFCPIGGWVTDRLSGRFGLNKGRPMGRGLGNGPGSPFDHRGSGNRGTLHRPGLVILGGGLAVFHHRSVLEFNRGPVKNPRRNPLRGNEYRRQSGRHPLPHAHALDREPIRMDHRTRGRGRPGIHRRIMLARNPTGGRPDAERMTASFSSPL